MDNCTIKRLDDSILLTIYIQEYVIVYNITHNQIIYTMDDITILYVRKHEWTIEDLKCKSLTTSHSLLSLLANVRMICLYNIDIAYRLFLETHNRAVQLSHELNHYEVPNPGSALLSTSMTTPSPDIPSSKNSRLPSMDNIYNYVETHMPRVFSNEGFGDDYYVTSSIIMKKH